MSCYVVRKSEIEILDSNLDDTEKDINAWTEGSYDLNTKVYHNTCVFRSLKENNESEPVELTTTLDWKYLYRVNKYKAFDPFNSTTTVAENVIEYVLKSRYIDIVGFFKLKAKKVILELYNLDADIATAEPLFEKTYITAKRDVNNYSDYIMADSEFDDILVTYPFPYYNTKLRIRIENDSGNVEIGNIVIGRKYDLGLTLVDPEPTHELENFYDVNIDKETGVIQQVPIMPTESGTIPILIETSQLDKTKNVLKEFMGEPTVWIAIKKTEKLPNLVFYGFYKTISTPISLNMSVRNIEIIGVP